MMLYQKNTVNGVVKGIAYRRFLFLMQKIKERKEEKKMTPTREEVKALREKYPNGTRVRLKKMEDDPRPVPVGTEGTVTGVDDTGSICVQWDNGSSLHVLYQIDEAEIIE